METYVVSGMTCAACQARVEKAVSRVPGVTSCAVNLLTHSMGVEGTYRQEDILQAVRKAGYGIEPNIVTHSNSVTYNNSSAAGVLEDREFPLLRKRLIASLAFLAVLMVLSMGHTMLHCPLPAWLSHNPLSIGLLQMLLAIVVMVINQRFFINGFRSLFQGAPNMDTLVAMGSAAAFVYSAVALFLQAEALRQGDMKAAMGFLHEFHFESAAMILTLITVGKMLEAMSKGHTTDALKGLMKLAPKTALVLRDGKEMEIPVAQVVKGDVFMVRPGASVPVDGVVLEGSSAVNEAALTGESLPVDKSAGDTVSAATLNQSGHLRCQATRVGEDTTLAQIIRMVSDAAATKAPIAKIADRVSGVFVPAVIAIAVVTTTVWLLMGQPFGFALARGIAVLVISCPCALGLATPVAIMVGNGVGARHGILFKTAVALEAMGRTQTVVLDKTGTLTNGTPTVTDILPADGGSEAELLSLAAALEAKSEHPLARAIMEYVNQQGIAYKELTEFQALPGNGLCGKLDGAVLLGGSKTYIAQKAAIPLTFDQTTDALAGNGKTPLFFAKDGRLLGVIAVSDVLKSDSAAAVRELKNLGIHPVMLTGDNPRTAAAIGRQADIDDVVAGVLPDGKEAVIRRLKQRGPVAMVGDGINDAPALTSADIGIAIGAGSDIAIDAADVVLMKGSLRDVAAAIRLSRATLRNIHENLFWAFFYNVLGIPLAAGCAIPWLGWALNPMFGAAAMSLSSFFVVTNALRLNLFNPHNSNHDKPLAASNTPKEKGRTMEKRTIQIEGMMCGHCEKAVKTALEALDAVTEAQVSHTAGTAVVTLKGDVSDALLKATVEAKDYRVISISGN